MKRLLLVSLLTTPLLYGPELVPNKRVSEFEAHKEEAVNKSQEGATIKRALDIEDQNSYYLLRHGMMVV